MTKADRLAVLAILDEVVVQLAVDNNTSAIVLDKLAEAQSILERDDVEELEELEPYDRDQFYYNDPADYEED